MPSERIHRLQAEQNERLARGLVLLSPQLMDWGVTMLLIDSDTRLPLTSVTTISNSSPTSITLFRVKSAHTAAKCPELLASISSVAILPVLMLRAVTWKSPSRLLL